MIFNETPPKKFKKVKAAELRLVDEHGKTGLHKVQVCMHVTTSPTFCVYVPPPYRDAWTTHRSKEHSRDYRGIVNIVDGWLHGPSFDQVCEQLRHLSDNYHRFISERTKEKVIVLALNLYQKGTAVAPCIKVGDLPSFSHPDVLVGLRSGVLWRVNSALYYDDRRSYFDQSEDPLTTEPTFEQLRRDDRWHNVTKIIPYSDEAWATVKSIQATLDRAVVMLHNLAGDQAQALLEGGLNQLLSFNPD